MKNLIFKNSLPGPVYITESAKKSSSRVISESLADAFDYWEDHDIYIGRTDDFYSEEDDDNVFQKPTWTYSEDTPNGGAFAAESAIYKLTDEGKEELSRWLDDYQTGYSLGSGRTKYGTTRGSEEEFQYLTDPENGLSEPCVEEADAEVGESESDDLAFVKQNFDKMTELKEEFDEVFHRDIGIILGSPMLREKLRDVCTRIVEVLDER